MRVGHVMGILAASVMVASTAEAQVDWESVAVTATRVAPGVYMVQGRGGNIGVSVGRDGVFLVDDQYAPLTDKVRAALRAITNIRVRFAINTHWHRDHSGGNENMGNAGALLVAHENVRQRMSTDQLIEFYNLPVAPSPLEALPMITFTDEVTFYLNGEEIRAMHVAHAHTDGDAIIHFPRANVVHMGDTFFHGRYPFIDLSSGGSINGVITAAERVLEVSDENTRIIPGHGPLASRADLQAYRDMLVAIRTRVQRMVAEGKSVDEIVGAGVTAEWDESLGHTAITPEAIVRFVYAGVRN